MEQSTSVLFPFLCDDCGWSYETNDKLQQHIKKEHMVEYSCSQPVDATNGALNGEHPAIRVCIKRNFVGAPGRSLETNPVCKKCKVSFLSNLAFVNHTKDHVHESELAVKVHRLQIPIDDLRGISNFYICQTNSDKTPEAELLQGDATIDNSPSVSSIVGLGSALPPLASSPAMMAKQSASAIQNSTSMDTPMSSELLSRSYLNELSGYMKDVTESILTSPHKGTDNNFDHMTIVDQPSKNLPSSTGGVHKSLPMSSSDSFNHLPNRDYSQPLAFPRVCSSPTENNPPFSPPLISTSPRGVGSQNPANPRLSTILQLPNLNNRSSQPPHQSASNSLSGSGFSTSTAASSHYGSSAPLSGARPYVNTSVANTNNAYGIHYSGGTQLNSSTVSTAGTSVSRNSPLTKCHAVSPTPVTTLHQSSALLSSSQTLTTMAPTYTNTSCGAEADTSRCPSVTVINQGHQSQVVQGSVSSSQGSQRQQTSLNASCNVRQSSQPTTSVSGTNPLAMLNQMNLSVSRSQAQLTDSNFSTQERPASVIVLDSTPENSMPSIHSVVSLHPGYKHAVWGNTVVPTSNVDGQHIDQNPNSRCQCLRCRDIRGGDLLRMSQQTDNGRCEYKCPKCQRLFTQKTSFVRHCKAFRHAFVCEMCHCGFMSERPFETHKSLHIAKGLQHSAPQPAQPAPPAYRPPGPRPALNPQMMTPGPQMRQYQNFPMSHASQQAAYQQQAMPTRMNPNSSAMPPHNAPKPASDEADDDVVVLECEPGAMKTVIRKIPSKPQYKRSVEKSMTVSSIKPVMAAPQQQQRLLTANATQGNRTNSLVPQRSMEINVLQQKSTNTIQILPTAPTATPPQISRILNNSELTLTPIARSQGPPTSTSGIVLRANPNMQFTDNGPQKPVQINVNSSMVGLQPIPAPRKPALPNILARRPQPANSFTTNAASSLQGSSLNNRPVNSSGGVLTVAQSQQNNVYKVVPTSASRSVMRPADVSTTNFQMNSTNRPGTSSAMPMWHHPVNAGGAQPGSVQSVGKHIIGSRSQVNSMNLRPRSLPSSHQSQGPNQYPSSAGQPQGNVTSHYVESVRLAPPSPYMQSPSVTAQMPYQQQRPPAPHLMQGASGSLPNGRSCRLCGGLFPTALALQNHFQQTHMQQAQNQGPLQHQQMIRFHHTQQPVLQQQSQHLFPQQPQQAGQSQPPQQAQQSELSRQLQEVQAPHVCRKCQKTFQSLLQFKSHENLCLEKVQCMKCKDMVFKDEVLSHYSKMHQNESPHFEPENRSQSDGTLTNRISPNNPIFALPLNAGLPVSPEKQSDVPPPLAVTGFNLSKTSDYLVNQMSIGSELLMPPPPLIRLSTEDKTPGVNENCTNMALTEMGVANSESMEQEAQVTDTTGEPNVPHDEQYFTNASVVQDEMFYPIIQSVQSLSNTTARMNSTGFEEPLSPVVALVEELVKTVIEEGNKSNSLLDETSGLFVEGNQDFTNCELEDIGRSTGGEVDELQSSIASEVPMEIDDPRTELHDTEPVSIITDSSNAMSVDEGTEVASQQADDFVWLHEPLSEDDSEDKPLHEEIGPIIESLSESDNLELHSAEVLTVVDSNPKASDASEDQNAGPVSEEVLANIDGSKLQGCVENPGPSTMEGAASTDDRVLALELPEGSKDEYSSDKLVKDKPSSVGDPDTDCRSEPENGKTSPQNDSETDTVALEDDGETSEVMTAEEKPPVCPICDLEFDDKAALVEHSQIHLGTPTHHCRFCSSSFSTNKLLSNHLRTHFRSCRDPPRNHTRKRRRIDDLFAPGAPTNMAFALFDYDKVEANSEFLRRLGIYGFIRFNDMKDFFCGKRRRAREPPLINLPDDEEEEDN